MPETNNKRRNYGIDVIIRVHTVGRQLELDRTLFSLIHQTFRPVHPIIVTQGFSADQTNAIVSLVGNYEWRSAGHLVPTIVNVHNHTGADLRSTLLNVGIANGSLRYLAFLDGDDYLYEYAYDYLIEQAENANAAISFGGIVCKEITVFQRFVFNWYTNREQFRGADLNDLLVSNFCPIHSFVVDRHRVADEDLVFDTTLKRLEDYDFLLRICTKYTSWFTSRCRNIGVYNWHLDGSGSIEFHQDQSLRGYQENKRLWNEAQRQLWRRKCTIRDELTRIPRTRPIRQ
jgi:glycosyltransferase involved in cell wall biosynthesis